ncbi:glycosyltransferase involved in cell wall biosynthesis [Antricoccus suffuscus]|uniref:Glycosyltransferase involved in cell wall biosynthesis n=1 Tax=Antricoccus suffuscus TaxID=1629062 RepID=A0A2T1A2D9_9ACTN|nr:glycosyltransferase involved in cell wall biosynthesis [Antricoccus suffuscus]
MVRRFRPREIASTPTVTVVIPCYNYGHYLPEVVSGVLEQPGVEVDVIIVDDASPDGSGEVARDLAASDPRVRLIAHSTNKGHIATYNDGLGQATGKYVVLLSADDLLTPGSLSRSVALLESRPDVSFVYGYTHDFEAETPEPRQTTTSWSVWSGDEWIGRLCRRGHNVITNPEVVMRTEVFARIGGYDPSLPHAADLYMWLAAAGCGNVGRVNGADQAFYRVHGANMHLTDYAGLMTDLRERRAVYDRFLTTEVARHSQRARWRRSSSRTLAREAVRLGCNSYDGHGPSEEYSLEDYARFAVETWSGIERTMLWRAYLRRVNGPVPSWRRSSALAVWRVRNALRWRRWRRFGT